MQTDRLGPILSCLTAVVFLAACGPDGAAEGIPNGWSTTSIPAWGVDVSYPPGWNAVNLPQLGFVNIREPEGVGDLVIWEMSYAAAEAIGLPYRPEMAGADLLQLFAAPKADEPGYAWEFAETEVLSSPAGEVYIVEAHSAPLAARTYLAVLRLADRVLTFEVRLQLDRNWGRYHPIYEQIIQSVTFTGPTEVTY